MLNNKKKVLQVAPVVKSSSAKPAEPQVSPSKAEVPSMDVADLAVNITVPIVKMPMPPNDQS
jgi:hypothetical protein